MLLKAASQDSGVLCVVQHGLARFRLHPRKDLSKLGEGESVGLVVASFLRFLIRLRIWRVVGSVQVILLFFGAEYIFVDYSLMCGGIN